MIEFLKQRALRKDALKHLDATNVLLSSLEDLYDVSKENSDKAGMQLCEFAIYSWLFLADVRLIRAEVELAKTEFERKFRGRMLSIPLYEFVEKDRGKIYRFVKDYFVNDPEDEMVNCLGLLIDAARNTRRKEKKFLEDIRNTTAAHRLPEDADDSDHGGYSARSQLRGIRELDLKRLLDTANVLEVAVVGFTQLWEGAVWRANDAFWDEKSKQLDAPTADPL